MDCTSLKPDTGMIKSHRKVYAVDKNALSSEPMYKQMRVIGSKRKLNKLESFFLLDISRVFAK